MIKAGAGPMEKFGPLPFFCAGGVDNFSGRALYTALTARRRPRRDDAPAELLTETRWISFRSARKLGAWVFLRKEGGTGTVPGCLTSESEERETWTAESLRAVFLLKERGRPDETRRFNVFGQHAWSRRDASHEVARRVWTSSNVVIGRIGSQCNLRV
jgi:hypothetical protein